MVVSDRIVVMNLGRIEGIGKLFEFYYYLKIEFVVKFLGLSNILEFEVENGIVCFGILEFKMGRDGKVRVFFRFENVFVKFGKGVRVIDYDFLLGRICLRLGIGGEIIIVECFFNELFFSLEDIFKEVSVEVFLYFVFE